MPAPIIACLADLAPRHDVLFCDLWGCLHDGVRPFREAVEALRGFRARGGYVMLLTNSPRPAPGVEAQLAAIGVPRDCWDAITSSGDAAQAALAAGAFGTAVHHVGPARDLSFFEETAPDIPASAVRRVPLAEAEGIVCTGLLDDETETPEDYRALILEGVNRRLPMLCANPDVVVDRGGRRVWCAGAIAEAYAQAGGEVRLYGKPHAPIYALARARLDAAGREAEDARILCVGDGLLTDIAGGIGEGLDTLFVTGGLAARETATGPGGPDPEGLRALLDAHRLSPTAAIAMLR